VRFRQLLLLGLWACSLTGVHSSRAAGDRPTSLTANAPVINFRVPTFNGEYRSWLLRGAKGIYVDDSRLDVVDLNLTVFSGDASNRVESVFLSPSAVALLGESRVRGPGAVRLITDDFEATGEDWSYDHRQKKVSIHRNVRVVFHAQLTDILR
jgi:lipopolysaccharide export system protein LptC